MLIQVNLKLTSRNFCKKIQPPSVSGIRILIQLTSGMQEPSEEHGSKVKCVLLKNYLHECILKSK